MKEKESIKEYLSKIKQNRKKENLKRGESEYSQVRENEDIDDKEMDEFDDMIDNDVYYRIVYEKVGIYVKIKRIFEFIFSRIYDRRYKDSLIYDFFKKSI